jgi:hypothetical protein
MSDAIENIPMIMLDYYDREYFEGPIDIIAERILKLKTQLEEDFSYKEYRLRYSIVQKKVMVFGVNGDLPPCDNESFTFLYEDFFGIDNTDRSLQEMIDIMKEQTFYNNKENKSPTGYTYHHAFGLKKDLLEGELSFIIKRLFTLRAAMGVSMPKNKNYVLRFEDSFNNDNEVLYALCNECYD